MNTQIVLDFLAATRIEIALFDMARFAGLFVEYRESVVRGVGGCIHCSYPFSMK